MCSIPFASGTAAAQSDDTTNDDYKINESGFIEYNGSHDAEYIEESVAGMNEAKRKGKIDFEIRNNQAYLVNTESSTQSVTAMSCSGNQGFDSTFKLSGIEHKLEVDSCTTNDLIDALIAGAAAAQISAIISGAVGAVPVAAASQCAAVLLAAGWQILDNNAKGDGVEIIWLQKHTGGGFDRFGIDPQ